MIIESKIAWTGKNLTEALNANVLTLDMKRQRGLCWNKEQQSLLIHSIIVGYPIPNFYVVKDGNQYSLIDGKQRTSAISGFINGEYALAKDTPPIELNTGEAYSISGKCFKELQEDVRDKIKDRSLEVHCLDGATDDELDDILYRLNNGSAMASIVKICAKTKSIERVNFASDHDIFKTALSASRLEKYLHKEITIKSWLALNQESPSFSSKEIQKNMETLDLSDDSILEMWDCFDRMLEVYQYIDQNRESKDKSIILANISKPTHFVSLILAIKQSIGDEIDINNFSEWVMTFFPAQRIASIDEAYNEAARSNKKENIRIRHNAIMAHYNKYFHVMEGEAV